MFARRKHLLSKRKNRSEKHNIDTDAYLQASFPDLCERALFNATIFPWRKDFIIIKRTVCVGTLAEAKLSKQRLPRIRPAVLKCIEKLQI